MSSSQFRHNLTQISRLINATIEPHYTWMADDDWGRLVRNQLGGARATMELLTKAGATSVTSLRSTTSARRDHR